ncbi:hypothetical protein IMG5_082420 [Ichthyophthirius multifiliis]|uniref:Transmembrane protein n=1 Tax=Ichthyophthirius multifiliis TaxID=5932 RepID=G0QQQ0_ICHMU|nr:hypothetical protein IMG5_082420 [Ichthyophthirius multifiliis]EGR32456.1 hypothetical protein IMG5_082420 [Ichthyophthirius multifiliis]|eukprot:XP_004036442.1 hypothetical protein IMG5_082420 [Ichthyophthirius multifiliis]
MKRYIHLCIPITNILYFFCYLYLHIYRNMMETQFILWIFIQILQKFKQCYFKMNKISMDRPFKLIECYMKSQNIYFIDTCQQLCSQKDLSRQNITQKILIEVAKTMNNMTKKQLDSSIRLSKKQIIYAFIVSLIMKLEITNLKLLHG